MSIKKPESTPALALPIFIVFFLVLGGNAVASSGSGTRYRTTDIAVERSLDNGHTWETVLQPGFPQFYWLTWDPYAPESVCVYYARTAPIGGLNRVECSWDGGDNWYQGPTSTQVSFETMPWFANDLTTDPDDESRLRLTAYDRIFSLARGMDGTLLVEEQARLPIPAICDGLYPGDICANLALEDVPAVWYDPVQSGQGITVVGHEGVFWGYYTVYDELGDAHWYLFQFKMRTDLGIMPETGTFITLIRYNGPLLGSEWDPAQVVGTPLAPAYIRFIPPRQMIFSHELGGQPVTLDLIPFQ